MAELTFKSAGISTKEIDLSGPTRVSPKGVPAGVVGTSLKGPAFVPVTVAHWQDFIQEFGATDGRKFGPLAMHEWLVNGSKAGTYVRVLGCGDGLRKSTTTGIVENAGFVVGSTQVQPYDSAGDTNGLVGANLSAGGASGGTQMDGRMYFLGALMSPAGNSTMLSDAGLVAVGATNSVPLVRGTLMAPQGVVLALSASHLDSGNNVPSATASGIFDVAPDDGGFPMGRVEPGTDEGFVLILNGHTAQPDAPNEIRASFNPQNPSYFPNVLNTDPTQTERFGHVLYAHWDIQPAHAVVDGLDLLDPGATAAAAENVAFLLSGAAAADTGNLGAPNYENFETRYKTAKSPWFTSQRFGGKPENLFKVHSLDDGVAGSDKVKISIQNIQASNSDTSPYGSFDLMVRKIDDHDEQPEHYENFVKLDLNPSSERYIGRVIGDQNVYYDFDKPKGAQKLVVEGVYPNLSRYIRVEISSKVENEKIDATALPVGFRGHSHLVVGGTPGASSAAGATAILQSPVISVTTTSGGTSALDLMDDAELWRTVAQLPVPMRKNLSAGTEPRIRVNSGLFWGVQTDINDDVLEQNKTGRFDPSILSFTKYFPDHREDCVNVMVGDNAGTPDDSLGDDFLVTVLDSDRYNNNAFSLEKIEVSLDVDGDIDNDKWADAQYQRAGSLEVGGTGSRFLGGANFKSDFTLVSNKKYLKFTTFLQGGFDGTNILDTEKANITNLAAEREMGDVTNQGGIKGPSVSAFRKAIDVMQETADVDIKLLAIPGLRVPAVVDYAIDAVEDRFDAMLIADIEEVDAENNLIVDETNSNPSVINTATRLVGRNLDSSFAAVYYPDVIMSDPTTGTMVKAPPSTAVLGAFAVNDSVAHPWFAPAGFTRGTLKNVSEASVKVSRQNLDVLYESDINPLAAFPHTPGVTVWGQKTLQQAKSALDRVNVRRLLIEVRRKVKYVGNRLLFEPNKEETLARFSAAVNPILQRIQAQQGLDKFKVVIDTSTTTDADIENNTVRGKIFLQPTRTVEFISLDFVVTNAGMDV